MVKTWKLVTRLVKNSRFEGWTSLDSFPTKDVKGIIIILTYGHMCSSARLNFAHLVQPVTKHLTTQLPKCLPQ